MFFISSAYAQAVANTGAAQGSLMSSVGLFAIILLLFWFMILRPQNKKMKEHQSMLNAIEIGDEIVLQGGMAGKIRKLGEQFLTVEIAKNVEVQVQRNAVAVKLEKGTLKSL